jgi:tetratricopeptide (TPR) repeat protein
LVYLGVARYRQGALEDAKTAMRQALRCAPGHPAATANLGAFMRITGEAEAAEALALLDDAPELPADRRALCHLQLQRTLALLQLGRAAEARSTLDALAALGPITPEIAPLWHLRRVLLPTAEPNPARAGRAAERMAVALESMGPGAMPEHRIMAHCDLARFWSGHNDPAEAFAHWRAGHDLLRQSQPFSRQQHREFVDASIAVLDRARFATGPVAGNIDPTPVFIVGMPRSGTTPCERILAAHGQVHGAGERAAVGGALGGGGGAQAVRRIAALDVATPDAAAARYVADLHALAPTKTRIVDKIPGNYLYLGFAGLLLPRAKIVFCVGDPRHRVFHLHLPLSWLSPLRARLGRSRLDHRAADPADGTLARGIAQSDPDGSSGRLGGRFRCPAVAGADASGPAARPELRAFP